MPTINKPKKLSKRHKHNRNIDIAKIYNSSNWVNLRAAYYSLHPLCEMCLKKGIIKPTEEIHHIKPISTGKDITEMMLIAYNPDNLMSLCCECHRKIHKQMKKLIKNDNY